MQSIKYVQIQQCIDEKIYRLETRAVCIYFLSDVETKEVVQKEAHKNQNKLVMAAAHIYTPDLFDPELDSLLMFIYRKGCVLKCSRVCNGG